MAKNAIDLPEWKEENRFTKVFALWSGVIRAICKPQLGRHCSTMSAFLLLVQDQIDRQTLP
jgi:hypothetical protein